VRERQRECVCVRERQRVCVCVSQRVQAPPTPLCAYEKSHTKTRPISKETNIKRDLYKRKGPTRETYIHKKSPTKEAYVKRDLLKETYVKRDLYIRKGPTKET